MTVLVSRFMLGKSAESYVYCRLLLMMKDSDKGHYIASENKVNSSRENLSGQA